MPLEKKTGNSVKIYQELLKKRKVISKKSWLRGRRVHKKKPVVTASQMPFLFGEGYYGKNASDVFEDVYGAPQEIEVTMAMFFGSRLEQTAKDWMKHLDIVVSRELGGGDTQITYRGVYDKKGVLLGYIGATLDGLVSKLQGKTWRGVLEVKTTNAQLMRHWNIQEHIADLVDGKNATLPRYVFYQVQTQMLVTGLKKACVIVCFGTSQAYAIVCEKCDRTHAEIVEKATHFFLKDREYFRGKGYFSLHEQDIDRLSLTAGEDLSDLLEIIVSGDERKASQVVKAYTLARAATRKALLAIIKTEGIKIEKNTDLTIKDKDGTVYRSTLSLTKAGVRLNKIKLDDDKNVDPNE